jgi:hypothetical protein
MIRKGQACRSAVGAKSVCFITLLLVCLEWKPNFIRLSHPAAFDSKVATLPVKTQSRTGLMIRQVPDRHPRTNGAKPIIECGKLA